MRLGAGFASCPRLSGDQPHSPPGPPVLPATAAFGWCGKLLVSNAAQPRGHYPDLATRKEKKCRSRSNLRQREDCWEDDRSPSACQSDGATTRPAHGRRQKPHHSWSRGRDVPVSLAHAPSVAPNARHGPGSGQSPSTNRAGGLSVETCGLIAMNPAFKYAVVSCCRGLSCFVA